MQSPETPDAPIVPNVTAATDEQPHEETATSLTTDGGRRPPERPFDRPPRTDHATEYTRDQEEIEPFVADLR